MNAMFAAAAIGAIHTPPPPPQVAPRLEAFYLADFARGTPPPSAGYLLTHRECVADTRPAPAAPCRFPFNAPLAGLPTPSAETLLAASAWDYFARNPDAMPFMSTGYRYVPNGREPAAPPAYASASVATVLRPYRDGVVDLWPARA